ncbi:hypothetical protein BJ875DRAFT_441769 [Amylocarpus encephaloides]|uniref:Uncharacterized protein n=1 Tax=Amylocarpus encephaloides TaxID=45428 RepID=A0A9P7YHY3_9HELO|nr:hypothetical protein BJ875DRAFT_441769 [Amylocarpus encephaloides]
MGVEREPDAQATTISRTVRILNPWAMLATVLVLAACSIIGVVVGALICATKDWHAMGEIASQISILLAASCSIFYLALHLTAAYHNEAIGLVRPPVMRLHGACFVTARIVFVLWIISIVISSVALSRMNVCPARSPGCKAEVIGVTISSFGFMTTGIILTGLEACEHPFQCPGAFGIPKRAARRPSFLDDEELDVSRRGSIDIRTDEARRNGNQRERMREKPLPRIPTFPTISELPERSLTSLLPMRQASKPQSWGNGSRHLVKEPGKKGLTKSDSAVSGLSRSSSGYISSDHSSEDSGPRRQKRPTVSTPSSSISNLTKRSPLSTVRDLLSDSSAEYPELVVRPELRYLPPNITAPYEWNLSRTASLSRLLPVADVQHLRRRSSITAKPYSIRRPKRDLPPLTHEGKRSAASINRRTMDIKIPRAYIEERLSLTPEREPAVESKEDVVLRSKSEPLTKPPVPPKDPPKTTEPQYMPLWTPFAQHILDSSARYREQRPGVIVPTQSFKKQKQADHQQECLLGDFVLKQRRS